KSGRLPRDRKSCGGEFEIARKDLAIESGAMLSRASFLILSCLIVAVCAATGKGGEGSGALSGNREVSNAGAEAGRARLLELRREIARHDELYFRHNAPVISDDAYDRLKRE